MPEGPSVSTGGALVSVQFEPEARWCRQRPACMAAPGDWSSIPSIPGKPVFSGEATGIVGASPKLICDLILYRASP